MTCLNCQKEYESSDSFIPELFCSEDCEVLYQDDDCFPEEWEEEE